MNNIMSMMGQFQQFMQNPAAVISTMKIPQQYANDPNGMIQYLMNTGKLSQQQYNQAVNAARQLQSNPQFQQMFGGIR